ncbi:MAG: FAD-binding oxidoreductase [Chloroflexi bacterium]|nr:FAD-binding oxidoreductase [Chloroflexota bacterium]
MTETADAIVVGGGAMGASIAYHLTAAGAGRVVLLEREAALGTGSTGRCAGGFRIQFSSEINVRLSLASVAMIKGFEAEHDLPLDVDVDGYLFLVRDESAWAGYRAAAAMQRAQGARVEELDGAAAAALIPGLNVDGVVGATFGPDDGIADPSGLTIGYATLARRHGTAIRLGTEVTAIRTSADGSRVTGVSTPSGDIDAPVVVNAAGVWARSLAATCGLDLPLLPQPRHVVTTSGFPGAPMRRTLVIDTATMFYFHREGAGVLMGMPRLADAVATFETVVDDRWIAEELLPEAIRVLPAIEDAGLARSWVGLYEMTPDHHAILGPVEGLEGIYLANGFSGHGFQHAPIVGVVITELVTGAPPTVDVSALRLERFARGDLIGESHVV